MPNWSQHDPGRKPEHWETLSQKNFASSPIFDVVTHRCRHPKLGHEGDFYVLESRDWVNILALTPEKQVVLVNQFRFGIGDTSWEIPGGVMEAGEEPIAAALRELKEETGYTSNQVELLGKVRPNPAIQSNTCYLALAKDAQKTEAIDWDHHEELEIKLVDIDQVYAMAFRGEIFHSLVLDALMLYQPEWEKLKARRRSPSA